MISAALHFVMSNAKAFRFLALLVVFFAGSAHGRPHFVLMDSSSVDHAPSSYGYTVKSTENGANTDFLLTLTASAAKALSGAKVFFHTNVKDEPSIKVVIEVVENKGKTIRFSVPTKHLSNCLLELDSVPGEFSKRPVGSNPIYADFSGYRLALHAAKEVNK